MSSGQVDTGSGQVDTGSGAIRNMLQPTLLVRHYSNWQARRDPEDRAKGPSEPDLTVRKEAGKGRAQKEEKSSAARRKMGEEDKNKKQKRK
ncbi:hypothetical protein Taro_039657, partial [Colocasia esculenta]|nr:hypothetical protein [Colocasia esculenta]